MPKINDIGYSKMTFNKHENFREFVQHHIKISDPTEDYYYIEGNAGSGKYAGFTGSPLIFLEEAAKYRNRKFKVILIELNMDNILKLTDTIKEYYQYNNISIYTLLGDNSDLLLKMPKNKHGLCFIDHNGIPPFKTISELSEKSKIDLLINCPTTNIKRVRLVWKQKFLLEYLSIIKRKNILFREPKENDPVRWSMILATNNARLKHLKRLKFHSINNEKFNKLNYTDTETFKPTKATLELIEKLCKIKMKSKDIVSVLNKCDIKAQNNKPWTNANLKSFCNHNNIIVNKNDKIVKKKKPIVNRKKLCIKHSITNTVNTLNKKGIKTDQGHTWTNANLRAFYRKNKLNKDRKEDIKDIIQQLLKKHKRYNYIVEYLNKNNIKTIKNEFWCYNKLYYFCKTNC